MAELDSQRVASIDEPLAKLNRGRDHLNNLELAVTRYVEDPSSFAIEGRQHPQSGMIVRATRLIDPPSSLALACGDAVHNIRASLDYLVRQLGIADSHRVSDKSEFPVMLDAGPEELRWRSTAGRTLKLLSPTHVSEIRRLQPFVDLSPNSVNVKLQNIDAFEQIDKHSLPLVVAAAYTGGDLTIKGGPPRVRLTPLARPPAEIGSDGTDLFWLQGWGKAMKPAELLANANITVLFGPAKVPIPALRDLADTVAGVIGSFALDLH
jgi:hypothetical protein